MRRLRYNVAVSLDGFIARADGSYDWILEDPTIDFGALFSEFDTLLMGRKTYSVVRSQGQSGPFAGMHIVVISRTLPPATEGNTTIVGEGIEEYVQNLRSAAGKDIWLFGGGDLFRHLLDAGLVDTVEVAIMPVLLGEGIPVLASGQSSRLLRLTSCVRMESGIVMLKYDTAAAGPSSVSNAISHSV